MIRILIRFRTIQRGNWDLMNLNLQYDRLYCVLFYFFKHQYKNMHWIQRCKRQSNYINVSFMALFHNLFHKGHLLSLTLISLPSKCLCDLTNHFILQVHWSIKYNEKSSKSLHIWIESKKVSEFSPGRFSGCV